MGVVCSFSFAAGLSIWFAGFVQLLLQKMHRKWEKVTIWLGSAASIFYIYFVFFGIDAKGFQGPVHIPHLLKQPSAIRLINSCVLWGLWDPKQYTTARLPCFLD